jgi:hypothetical protein
MRQAAHLPHYPDPVTPDYRTLEWAVFHGQCSLWLDQDRTSFETRPASAPQDDVLLNTSTDLPHPEAPREARPRRTHDMGAIQTETLSQSKIRSNGIIRSVNLALDANM